MLVSSMRMRHVSRWAAAQGWHSFVAGQEAQELENLVLIQQKTMLTAEKICSLVMLRWERSCLPPPSFLFHIVGPAVLGFAAQIVQLADLLAIVRSPVSKEPDWDEVVAVVVGLDLQEVGTVVLARQPQPTAIVVSALVSILRPRLELACYAVEECISPLELASDSPAGLVQASAVAHIVFLAVVVAYSVVSQPPFSLLLSSLILLLQGHQESWKVVAIAGSFQQRRLKLEMRDRNVFRLYMVVSRN